MSQMGQKATSRPHNPTSAIASGADIVRNGSEKADTAIYDRPIGNRSNRKRFVKSICCCRNRKKPLALGTNLLSE
jgi:hypothetical protein